MEEKRKEKLRERQNGDQTPEVLGGPTDRRSLNVILGTGFFNQMDQTRKAVHEESGMKTDKKQFLPKPLRVLSFIGGLFLLFGCIEVILLFVAMDGEVIGKTSLVALGLGVGIPVYGGLRLLEAYLERRDWVRRMQEEDRKKR